MTPEHSGNSQPTGGTSFGGRAKLAGGALITAVSRAYAQLSQIVIFIFAARTLGPEEFGFFALVSAFAIVALKVAEAGWSEYIMSWSGGWDGLQRVFGLSWISGLVMTVIGIAAAAATSLVTGNVEIQLLIAGFAIWILLATPSAALNGVMIVQGRIIRFALNGMISETVGLIVTLILLASGYGVLSLIGGRLAQQSVFLLNAAFATRLIPDFGFRKAALPGLVGFSLNILASRLIVSLRGYAAVFIVGGFFGPAAVGFYRAGERVVGAFSEMIGEPVRVLVWKTFRSARDAQTPEAYQNFANIFFPTLAVIAIPGFAWICLFAEPIIVGLLGAEWAPAAPVIAILSVAALLGTMGFATEPMLSLTGNTSLLPRLFLSYAIMAIIMTLIAGPFGMIAVSVAQVVVAVIIFVVNLYVYRKKVGFAWGPVLRNILPAVVPLAVYFVLLIGIDQLEIVAHVNLLLRACIISIPSFVIYTGLLALFYRSRLRVFWRRN